MQPQYLLIVKVLILSTFLSILIKYGGRFLPIEANSTNALIAIFLPALIMTFLISWRIYKNN